MKCNRCNPIPPNRCEDCGQEMCPDCLYVLKHCRCGHADPNLLRGKY